MTNIKMTGRLAGAAVNETRFWTEHRAERSIVQSGGVPSLCEDFCLWFFYFQCSGGEKFKYLGFLDMDVHGHDFTAMSGTQIRHVFCQLFEPALNQAFGRHWMAYFSGSKGFHVYLLKEEFFFRIDTDEKTGQDKDQMVSALRELLPLDLFVQIDLSVYAYNKGVRPWTMKNPKVDRHRQIRIAPENCPVLDAHDFFEWIAETLSRGGGPNNRLLSQVMAEPRSIDKPRTPEFAPESALQVSAAMDAGPASLQSLCEWIKKTRDLAHLPVVKRVDPRGNIYFEDQDAWCFCDPGEVTTHSRCKSWWRLNLQDNTASQQCLAERHRQMKFVLNFAVAHQRAPSVADFDAEFFPGQVTVVPETEQYLPRELIENLLMPEGSRLLVCAPMGTGKTYGLNSLIQAHRETSLKRVLVLGTRQSQCCVFQGAFKNFTNYLDPQERPLYEVPHLILCLNSLMKVAKYDSDARGFVVPHYDLLVVDEVMTLLSALVSPLLSTANTYQTAIFEMFKLLLKSSARVVMMDGLPGPLIYRFLSDQKVNLWHQTKVLKHVRPSEKKRFVFQPDPKKLEALMSDCLAVPEKSIVVVSDSKKILKYLQLEVASKNCPDSAMTICGDSTATIKRSATDPRVNWRTLRYLGYNTALGPGASYDARTREEGAFDEIFVFVTCKSSTPSEIYQLISRIRHPLNGRVHVCVLNSKNNSAFLQEAMDKSLDEQLEMMTHKLMSEVLQFDRLAQQRLANHLPLLVKRQRGDDVTNWTELQLNQSPSELVRQLAREQKLRLVYEPNDFLSLLAWAKLEIEKTKNSKVFVDDLQRLIRLGGGVLEIHPCEKQTIASQTDFMRTVRSEGKTRESRNFPADSLREHLGADVLRKMSDMIEVENFATQVRFFSLIRHLKNPDSAEDRFSRQVERLFVPPPDEVAERPGLLNVHRFSRVPASMSVTLLELCPPFEKLVACLGLGYDAETFHIEGSWNTQLLDEKRLEIRSVLQELGRARRKVDGHYDDSAVQGFSCDYKDYKRKCTFFRSFSALISDFFKWCGFTVQRVNKSSSRPKTTTYVLDKRVSQLRYAMAGFKCDDLSEMVNPAAALLYFAQNCL